MAFIFRTQLAGVLANSGSARDIQIAVDQAVIQGINNVHIPEGTFNFVEVGESWKEVVSPAGINFFGAPTERASGLTVPSRGMNPNGQVVEWKTVLVMPWDVPGGEGIGIPCWFKIVGSSDHAKPSRFSDIKLMGYRSIDNQSTSMHLAIEISEVINFRVDHCCFEHTCGGGLRTSGHYCCGVIDHNIFDNQYGIPDPYADRTVGYGIFPSRADPEFDWEPVQDILGKYTDYSVFIEDNYFTKWRHLVAGNFGVHYVFRHNTIEHGFAYGEVDAHQAYEGVGNRAVESYENEFKNPEPWTVNWAGEVKDGCGCMFNNTVSGYSLLVFLYSCADFYIWNNDIGSIDYGSAVQENVNFFLYKPDWYTPYEYPHQLVTGAPPPPPNVTPWSGELEEKTYRITVPQTVVDGENTYNFVQWEDSSTNPTRTIDLITDLTLTAIYELVTFQAIITGQIIDQTSSTPIEGANIKAGIYETLSDSNGAFTLNVPVGNYILIITKEGYAPLQIIIDVIGDITLAPIAITVADNSPLPWILALAAIAYFFA